MFVVLFRARSAPALLALALAHGACTEGSAVDRACVKSLPLYEQALRPAISPLTGVDTAAAMPSPLPSDACFSTLPNGDDYATMAYPLPEGRLIPEVPLDAAHYPWTAPCGEGFYGVCITDNTCPYGIQALQGTWIDADRGDAFSNLPPPQIASFFGDESNLFEVDGNTFRWRTVNRASGERLDVRGAIFCPRTGPWLFVATALERFTGPTCPLRYSNPSGALNDRTPRAWWPDDGLGLAVWASVLNNTRDNDASSLSPLMYLWDWYHDTREHFYCHPGEYVGDVVSPTESDQTVPFTCPEAFTFFDCW